MSPDLLTEYPDLPYIKLYGRSGIPFQAVDAQAFQSVYAGMLQNLQPLHAERNPQLIISLTSIPKRLSYIFITLYSLFCQTVRPDRIILWLAPEEFFSRYSDASHQKLESILPAKICALQNYGLEICLCRNCRSYNKIVHTLRQYPEAIIVTADDDQYYAPQWLAGLMHSYTENPECVHTYWAKKFACDQHGNPAAYAIWKDCQGKYSAKPAFAHAFLGVSGVLYPPHSLHPDALKSEIFLKLNPTTDDLWLWGMAVLAGHKTSIVATENSARLRIIISKKMIFDKTGTCLCTINDTHRQNDIQLARLLQAYPQIRRTLEQECNLAELTSRQMVRKYL